MGLSKFYKMNEAAVEHGKWVPWHEGELKIARLKNSKAEKLKKELIAPFERPGFRQRRISEAKQVEILVQVLAYTVLLDWRDIALDAEDRALLKAAGIEVSDSGDVAYTPEIGVALLNAYEDFREDVLTCANNEELYREADLGEDEGKS